MAKSSETAGEVSLGCGQLSVGAKGYRSITLMVRSVDKPQDSERLEGRCSVAEARLRNVGRRRSSPLLSTVGAGASKIQSCASGSTRR
jgi:hypothetical protein